MSKSLSRREFVKVTLGTAGAGLLYSCAPSTQITDTPEATEAGYTGKIVVMSGDEPRDRTALIQAMEEANPGITMEFRDLTDEHFVELFAAADLAGEQIDIMEMNGQHLRNYALAGKLLDLSDLPYLNRFREAGLKTFTVHDKLYAIPRGAISGAPFLYNKKILEKIGVTKEPETYDELLDIAKELKSVGIAPFVHPVKNLVFEPMWEFMAFAQTSGNRPLDATFEILGGQAKFTDPEHVAALEIIYNFVQDGMFLEGIGGMDTDAAVMAFAEGKAAYMYFLTFFAQQLLQGDYPELDLSLISPVRFVSDASIQRQSPGGTGLALGIYSGIAPERLEVAQRLIDLETSDKWIKWVNEMDGAPVSANKNVAASTEPLFVKYAEECAPGWFIWLDWYWPPEVTRAFQESIQGILVGDMTPDEAAQAGQKALEELYKDGYTFEV